jgi:hypothetical protein
MTRRATTLLVCAARSAGRNLTSKFTLLRAAPQAPRRSSRLLGMASPGLLGWPGSIARACARKGLPGAVQVLRPTGPACFALLMGEGSAPRPRVRTCARARESLGHALGPKPLRRRPRRNRCVRMAQVVPHQLGRTSAKRLDESIAHEDGDDLAQPLRAARNLCSMRLEHAAGSVSAAARRSRSRISSRIAPSLRTSASDDATGRSPSRSEGKLTRDDSTASSNDSTPRAALTTLVTELASGTAYFIASSSASILAEIA